MILVDTSVWVDHLRIGNLPLEQLLVAEKVAIHPFVMGELACGHLRRRATILGLLQRLPTLKPVSHEEALHLVEARRLYGKGLSWIDIHLVASCQVNSVSLWTRDRALARVANELGLSFRP